MGYETASKHRTRGKAVTLKASGATTATGTTSAQELGDKGTVRMKLAVTAASGTSPTLAVQLQTSSDGGSSDSWRSLGSAFTTATTTTSQYISVGGCDRFLRASYTVGGTTPSFTWSLIGEAV